MLLVCKCYKYLIIMLFLIVCVLFLGSYLQQWFYIVWVVQSAYKWGAHWDIWNLRLQYTLSLSLLYVQIYCIQCMDQGTHFFAIFTVLVGCLFSVYPMHHHWQRAIKHTKNKTPWRWARFEASDLNVHCE